MEIKTKFSIGDEVFSTHGIYTRDKEISFPDGITGPYEVVDIVVKHCRSFDSEPKADVVYLLMAKRGAIRGKDYRETYASYLYSKEEIIKFIDERIEGLKSNLFGKWTYEE